MPVRTLFWAFACGGLAADHLTKWLIYQRVLAARDVGIVPGFFYLRRAQNAGVVWGLFGRWPAAVAAAGILAAVVVVFFFYKYGGASRLEAAAWGAILGGAMGNLIDRILLGHVRDFLDFQVAGRHWPTFNVADSCITVGAVFLILRYFSSGQARE